MDAPEDLKGAVHSHLYGQAINGFRQLYMASFDIDKVVDNLKHSRFEIRGTEFA